MLTEWGQRASPGKKQGERWDLSFTCQEGRRRQHLTRGWLAPGEAKGTGDKNVLQVEKKMTFFLYFTLWKQSKDETRKVTNKDERRLNNKAFITSVPLGKTQREFGFSMARRPVLGTRSRSATQERLKVTHIVLKFEGRELTDLGFTEVQDLFERERRRLQLCR